jgi:Ca2+-transporting ATPase
MVTGDSKETAVAIARRCGIIGGSMDSSSSTDSSLCDISTSKQSSTDDDDEMSDYDLSSHNLIDDMEYGSLALSGSQLDAIGAHNLADSIIGVKVFYRVAPRHKLALVRAFQKRGEVVAMTGDGVNDATALTVCSIYVVDRLNTPCCRSSLSTYHLLPQQGCRHRNRYVQITLFGSLFTAKTPQSSYSAL